MGQSRWMSLMESKASTAIGFGVSWVLMQWVVPLIMDARPNPTTTTAVVVIFTAASIARQYTVRRLFNWINHRRRWAAPSRH